MIGGCSGGSMNKKYVEIYNGQEVFKGKRNWYILCPCCGIYFLNKTLLERYIENIAARFRRIKRTCAKCRRLNKGMFVENLTRFNNDGLVLRQKQRYRDY